MVAACWFRGCTSVWRAPVGRSVSVLSVADLTHLCAGKPPAFFHTNVLRTSPPAAFILREDEG